MYNEVYGKSADIIERLVATDGTEYLYRGIWTPQVGELYLDGARIRVSTEDYPDKPRAVWVKVHKGVSNVYTSDPSPSMNIIEAARAVVGTSKAMHRKEWSGVFHDGDRMNLKSILATDWVVD